MLEPLAFSLFAGAGTEAAKGIARRVGESRQPTIGSDPTEPQRTAVEVLDHWDVVARPLQARPLVSTGVDFCGAQLNSASFQGALLNGADFSGASLHAANFNGASLVNANFCGARLNSASFQGALLNGADFSGASLHAANFNGADFRSVY